MTETHPETKPQGPFFVSYNQGNSSLGIRPTWPVVRGGGYLCYINSDSPPPPSPRPVSRDPQTGFLFRRNRWWSRSRNFQWAPSCGSLCAPRNRRARPY